MIDTAAITKDYALTLALESERLNARDWSTVSSAIPSWHPRMEGDPPADPPADPPKDPADPPKPKGDDDPDPDPKDDALEAAQKAAAAANRELRKLKAEKDAAEEKAKRERGEFEKLYEEEKAKREDLETRAERGARERIVLAALTKAKAKNPARALKLMDDLDDVDDAASAERAVKKLQKSDDYLFAASPTRQKRGAGGTDGDEDPDTGPQQKRTSSAPLDWAGTT